jgi:carboxyl-terminal processing protease
MKLTTAKWYIASGRLIEKPERWDTEDEELAEGEAGAEPERPEYQTAGGRVVYGGGGVTPDIVVEPVRRADVVVDLERREEFFEFAIDYAGRHGSPPSGYEIGDGEWTEFLEFLDRDEFEYELSDVEAERTEIERAIRRDMARKFDSRETAYLIAAEGDEQVMRTAEFARQSADLDDLFTLAEDYEAVLVE